MDTRTRSRNHEEVVHKPQPDQTGNNDTSNAAHPTPWIDTNAARDEAVPAAFEGSRSIFLIALFLAAALTAGSVKGASTPVPTVGCDQVTGQVANLSPTLRVLFNRVAVAPLDYWGMKPVPSAPLGYWAKAPVWVRAGAGPVSLSVPRAWRKRLAITFGNSGNDARALKFSRCTSLPNRWFAYAGGFYLSQPACVPLVIRVAGRTASIRFGIGSSCVT
jgi:hypothetical protein